MTLLKNLKNDYKPSSLLISCVASVFVLITGMCYLLFQSTPVVQSAGNCTYVVAVSGSDSNPGTSAAPFRTVQHGVDAVRAGETLCIRGGTYNERVVVHNSGANGAYITIQSYPGETPIINGSGQSVDNFQGVFDMTNRSYIHLIGLMVENSSGVGIFASNASYLTLERNHTYRNGSSGIGIWYSNHITANGNDVENSGSNGANESMSFGGVDTFEIRNNTIHNPDLAFRKEGIDTKEGSRNGSVHDNHIYDMRAVALYVDSYDTETYNIDVYNNRIHDCEGNGIVLGAEHGGLLHDIRIYNNIVYNIGHFGLRMFGEVDGYPDHPMANITIINNTIYNCASGIENANDQFQGPLVIRNNILSQNGSQIQMDRTPAQLSVDHNLIDGPTAYTGNNAISGSPQFVAPGSNFHLQATSPAIDSGSSTAAPAIDYERVTRPQGGGFDIGAYEYGGTPPPAQNGYECVGQACAVCADPSNCADNCTVNANCATQLPRSQCVRHVNTIPAFAKPVSFDAAFYPLTETLVRSGDTMRAFATRTVAETPLLATDPLYLAAVSQLNAITQTGVHKSLAFSSVSDVTNLIGGIPGDIEIIEYAMDPALTPALDFTDIVVSVEAFAAAVHATTTTGGTQRLVYFNPTLAAWNAFTSVQLSAILAAVDGAIIQEQNNYPPNSPTTDAFVADVQSKYAAYKAINPALAVSIQLLLGTNTAQGVTGGFFLVEDYLDGAIIATHTLGSAVLTVLDALRGSDVPQEVSWTCDLCANPANCLNNCQTSAGCPPVSAGYECSGQACVTCPNPDDCDNNCYVAADCYVAPPPSRYQCVGQTCTVCTDPANCADDCASANGCIPPVNRPAYQCSHIDFTCVPCPDATNCNYDCTASGDPVCTPIVGAAAAPPAANTSSDAYTCQMTPSPPASGSGGTYVNDPDCPGRVSFIAPVYPPGVVVPPVDPGGPPPPPTGCVTFTKTPNPSCILQSAATKTAVYTFAITNNCPDPFTNATIIDPALGLTYAFPAPIPAGASTNYVTPPQNINVTTANNATLTGIAGTTPINATASSVVQVLDNCSCNCNPTCPHGNAGRVSWHACHLYDAPSTGHWAIDYAWGGNVLAPGCGTVELHPGYGGCYATAVFIISDDGHYLFQLLHIDPTTVAVTNGQHVCTGEVLGITNVGADSPCSTGTHLHFAVRRDGVWVDPNSYVGVCYTSTSDPCDLDPTRCSRAGCGI